MSPSFMPLPSKSAWSVHSGSGPAVAQQQVYRRTWKLPGSVYPEDLVAGQGEVPAIEA